MKAPALSDDAADPALGGACSRCVGASFWGTLVTLTRTPAPPRLASRHVQITDSGAAGLIVDRRQIAGSVCESRVESDVLCAFQPRVLARRVRSPL
jgi:hypothetical protein